VKRVAALVAVLTAVVVAAPAATALGAGPGLAETAGTRFPDRAYALTLPKSMSLRSDQVQVSENGHPVPDVTVRSPDQVRSDRYGVVLAIDTSLSMRGKPLRGAIAAARAFLDHRNPSQPVALLTFAGDVRVLRPFTTSSVALDAAVNAIRVTGSGSHIMDAGAEAISLIRAAHIPSGSVVLLTDGADRGSRTTVAALSSAAKAAGARLFTVGLRSSTADFGALNILAATTSGEFSAAASIQDLARVYQRLGSVLAHQYLIEYRSSAGPHVTVHVDVRVAGLAGVAHAGYVTPSLDRRVRAPFHRDPSERLWTSGAAPLAASIVVSALLALAIWLLLRPRRGSLLERLSAYVSAASSDPHDGPATLTGRRALAAAKRSLDRRSWSASLQQRFDVGRIRVSPERALAWVAGATLLMLFTGTLVAGPVGIVAAFIVPVAAHVALQHRVAKQRSLFADQLPDNLQVIASAMRAGHSFVGALQVVVEDAPEPTRRELTQVIADERLGVPLEDAFATVVRRMESKDLEQVALVAALQRETGGNTAEVLDRVNQTMRDRMALRRLVRGLTAQGRMSRWVLTAIPVVLLFLLTSINPRYMDPLYTTGIGKALLVVAATMVVAGSLVIKRIVNITV
jgi:tight adherence protein B